MRDCCHRYVPSSVGCIAARCSFRARRHACGASAWATGLTLADGQKLRVAGIVDDDLAALAELVLSRGQGGDGRDCTGQLLVATTRPRRIIRRLGEGDGVRVRSVAPGVRSSPALVARAIEIKTRFGEFAVSLPYGEDFIGVEPGWLRRNVVTRSVPILGPVTCNRRLFPPLRRALRTLQRRGLSHLVDRTDYAGCYAPRRIPGGLVAATAEGLAGSAGGEGGRRGVHPRRGHHAPSVDRRAQAVLGVSPDLTAMGKIIGGGFPVGAVGGRADLLALCDPDKPRLFHSGTFNGNPVTTSAGLVSLQHLTADQIDLMATRAELETSLPRRRRGRPASIRRSGSMLQLFFSEVAPDATNERTDGAAMTAFHLAALNHGVFSPRGLLALSTVLDDEPLSEAGDRLAAAMTDLSAEMVG